MLTNSIWGDIKYQFSYGNAAIKLIFANVGIFLIVAIFKLVCVVAQVSGVYTLILHYLQIPANPLVLMYQPWSAFTYMFLHEGVLHILFNMLWLYWFSEIVILFIGDKKILPIYILGGLAGAAIYVLIYNTIPYFKQMMPGSYMLGASAGVLAIVWAAVALSPDYEIRLFIIGNVKIKYVALFSIVLDVISIPYGNAGGYIAHIGGALMGYWYIRILQGGTDLAAPFTAIGNLFKPKPVVKLTHKSETKVAGKPIPSDKVQEKLDAILDKMNESGYDSLSKEEKDFLFRYSDEK